MAFVSSSAKIFAIRLHPGQDLMDELVKFAAAKKLKAGFLVTCVGSLTKARLRFANNSHATEVEGPFEICSLVGTLSPPPEETVVTPGEALDPMPHLHISLADGSGKMVGGHLLEGCKIYTTAEIVIGEATELVFSRPVDPATTWDELVIQERK
jgi:uncharacterized protein